MRQPSTWRMVAGLVMQARESGLSFVFNVFGVIVLVVELVAPPETKLILGLVALLLLLAGFVLYIYSQYRTARLLLGEKPVPVLLVAGWPRSTAMRDLEKFQQSITRLTNFKAFRHVEQSFNVRYEELMVHREEPLPADAAVWQHFLERAQQQVGQFSQHVAGERVYHVAVKGPPSLALGFGAILGTRNLVVGYQFNGTRYHPVLNLSQGPRPVRTSPLGSDFHLIRVTYPGAFADDTAVVLDLGGYPTSGAAKTYLTSRLPSAPLVEIEKSRPGNLPLDDWVPVVQELFAVFNTLQRDPRVRRIHLFHAMPVAMALGLGMALGISLPVVVYERERTDTSSEPEMSFHPVLQLNQLRNLL